MSYDRITPAYYQTFQPDTAYHPGARGWTKAPWPTWGDNPNLAGRRTLATDGLGAVTAISGLGSPDGLGAYFANFYNKPITPAGGGASTVAHYQAIDGASCAPCAAKAASGFGATVTPVPPPLPVQSTVSTGLALAWRLLSIVGSAAGAYHGYKRNDSVGWALGWAIFGSAMPIFALPLAFAQGFGKPKSYARNGRRRTRRMRSNRKWSRAYKDSLPDSSFLYVSPGGRKTTEGGKKVTIPRSLRHFPYKTLGGLVDYNHIRSAIGRIPRSGVAKSLKPKLQAKARKILDRGW